MSQEPSFFATMRDKGYLEEDGDMRVYAFSKKRRLCDIVVLFDTNRREIDAFLCPSNLIHGEIDIMELHRCVTEMNADLEYFLNLSGYTLSELNRT